MTPLTLSGCLFLGVLLALSFETVIDLGRYIVASHASALHLSKDSIPLLAKLHRELVRHAIILGFGWAYAAWLVSP